MIIYLITINLLSFILFGIDKLKSINNKYRISEFTLLFIAFLGGAIGGLLGMIIFHHKTKKIKFIILIPLFIIFQIIILIKMRILI